MLRKEEFIQLGDIADIINIYYYTLNEYFGVIFKIVIKKFFIVILFRSNGRDGFGIHAINCTQHPYGDIGLSEMEHTIQAKYGDFSKYDAFMDDNMGLWTNDLDPYVRAFQVST